MEQRLDRRVFAWGGIGVEGSSFIQTKLVGLVREKLRVREQVPQKREVVRNIGGGNTKRAGPPYVLPICELMAPVVKNNKSTRFIHV